MEAAAVTMRDTGVAGHKSGAKLQKREGPCGLCGAAVAHVAKEPWIVVSISEFAVAQGIPTPEVFRQIETGNPQLFVGSKPKPKRKK